jgi:hypothetical protein
MQIQSSPDWSRLDLRRLLSGPATLSQVRKFVLWYWICRVVELPRSGSHAPQTCCNSKQSAFEEAAEPEPEPKERIKTDSKLTRGVLLTEDGIKVLRGHSFKRAATKNKLTENYEDACLRWGDSGGEEGVFVSPDLRCFIASSYLQGLVHRHLIQITGLEFKARWLLLKLSFPPTSIFF